MFVIMPVHIIFFVVHLARSLSDFLLKPFFSPLIGSMMMLMPLRYVIIFFNADVGRSSKISFFLHIFKADSFDARSSLLSIKLKLNLRDLTLRARLSIKMWMMMNFLE
jgi:hypothetical protein